MTETSKGVKGMTVRREVVRWAVKQVVATALIGVGGFLAAGRLDWAGGWALLGIFYGYFLFTLAVLVPRNPGLYAERSSLKRGTKKWDVALSLLVSYTPLYLCVVAGLDLRNGWTVPMAPWLRIAMGCLTVAGFAVLSWAMMANNYFSATVRIQADRGQTVVSDGPYRFVRHPGYVGGFLLYTGLVGVLGSVLGFAALAGTLALLVVRTAFEDATLQRELPGYREFCGRTRYRLFPGVW